MEANNVPSTGITYERDDKSYEVTFLNLSEAFLGAVPDEISTLQKTFPADEVAQRSGMGISNSLSFKACYLAFVWAIRQTRNVGEKYFLDVGSGSGGPLIVAKLAGFDRSYGIEWEWGRFQKSLANLKQYNCPTGRVCFRSAEFFSSYNPINTIYMFSDGMLDDDVRVIVARIENSGSVRVVISTHRNLIDLGMKSFRMYENVKNTSMRGGRNARRLYFYLRKISVNGAHKNGIVESDFVQEINCGEPTHECVLEMLNNIEPPSYNYNGELSSESMSFILNTVGRKDVFCDLGSGRALLAYHVALKKKPSKCIAVENALDVMYDASVGPIYTSIKNLVSTQINLIHADICQVESLRDTTTLYVNNVLFPPEVNQHINNLIKKCTSLKHIFIYVDTEMRRRLPTQRNVKFCERFEMHSTIQVNTSWSDNVPVIYYRRKR